MFNRVKSSLQESASTIKGILVRPELSARRSEDETNTSDSRSSPLFRLGFHHHHPTHADVDERYDSLRKEWKKYVKMHSSSPGEDCEEQFRAVLNALEHIHRGQNQSGKIDIAAVLGKESGFCVELARRFVIGLDGLTWILQDAKLLPLLFALSYLDWERSTIKGYCELKLPSVLIRALHDHLQSDAQFTEHSPSTIVEDIVLDIVSRMLEHRETIESLSELSDSALSLLFDMCTLNASDSPTAKHCRTAAWKVISRIPLTFEAPAGRSDVAGSGLALYTLSYGLLGRFVNRLSRFKIDWSIPEVIEATGVMVHLVRTLSQFSLKILDEFENCDGFRLFESFFQWVEELQASQDCTDDFFTSLVRMVVSLIFPANMALCKPQGQILKGVGNELRVTNPRPFDVLISSFLASRSHELRRIILETIVDIYVSHRENYSILHCPDLSKKSVTQKCRGISEIIEKLESCDEDLAETALQMVLHLITVLGCKPEQELLAFTKLLTKEPCLQIQLIICRCLNEVVEHDSSFRDIFRDLGILQTLLQIVLESYAKSHELSMPESEGRVIATRAVKDHVNILMIESLAVIVKGHKQNARIVREQGLPCFLQLVWNDTLHSSSLRLIGHISRSGTDEDTEACIAGLCEMLQSDPCDKIHQRLLTSDVLSTLTTMVENSEIGKNAIRVFGGFKILIDIFARLKDHFNSEDDDNQNIHPGDDVDLDVQSADINLELFTEKHAAKLFQEAISLLSVSTVNNLINYRFLWSDIGAAGLANAVACTNIFRSKFCNAALNSMAGLAIGARVFDIFLLPPCLFDEEPVDEYLPWIAPDDGDNQSFSAGMHCLGRQRWSAEPLLLLIKLSGCMYLLKAQRLLTLLTRIASSRPDHAQRLASAGTLPILRKMLLQQPHQGRLSRNISELAASVGSISINTKETGMLLRLSWKFSSEHRSLLVPALVKMAGSGQSCSYLRFSSGGEASSAMARMPQLGSERLWPPLTGYSFACWVYIESFDNGVLRLFELTAASKKGMAYEQHVTSIHLNRHPGCLSIQSSSTDVLTFSSFRFQEHVWYHIVIIHTHHMLHSSTAALYVNGLLREQGHLKSGLSLKAAMLNQVQGIVSTSSACLTASFGSSDRDFVPRCGSWRLRSALLIEGPLTAEHIYDLYWTSQAFNRYQGSIAECEDLDIAESSFIYKSIDSTDEAEFSVPMHSPKAWMENIVLSAHIGSIDMRTDDDSGTMNGIGGFDSSSCEADKVSDLILGQEWQLDGSVAVINCRTICDSIRSVGGISAVLYMLEKSESSSDLLNLLRLIKNLLWGNVHNLCQMSRIKGYEILGRILQSKSKYIDSKNVLEMSKIMGMGMIPTLSIVANAEACKHLLVDFRIWRKADPSLVSEAFYGLVLFLKRNIRRKFNAKKFKEINLVPFLCLHLCQQHLIGSGVDSIIELLAAFVTMEIRQFDLQEIANLILLAAKNPNRPLGRAVTTSDPTQSVQSEKITRDLLSIILQLVRSADNGTIEAIAAVLEPAWFGALLTQSDNTLAGLVRSENFLLRLRASSVFMLLGELLNRYHDSEKVYVATFQLMLGRYLSADPNILDCSFDLQTLRAVFPEANIMVPEVLPLILQMLRHGMKLEMTLADRLRAMPQDECSTMTSLSPRCTTIEEETTICPWTVKSIEETEGESSESMVRSLVYAIVEFVCSEQDGTLEMDGGLGYDASRSRLAAAAFRAEEIGTLNWTAASFLSYLYDRNMGVREKFLKHEIIEAVVGLLFLADDQIDLEVEAAGDDGPLSKVKDEVLKRVSGLFRSSGDKRGNNQSDSEAAGCNPSAADGDEWDYFRESEGHAGRASSEVLSSCSLHEKNCTMSTATGEIFFQLLSRITEESIRTQTKGINAVFVALESIPLSTIASAERGFAGRLLSSLSKYLYVGSVEMDILGDSGLVRNLEQFCELIVDIICVDSYPVAHSSPLDFIILVIDKILQAEDRAQDFPVLVARHLVTLHRTANRLVLHLLLRLQYHPERLQAVVASLADKVTVVFSPYNNEAPTLMLIGHALFTLFFHEVRDVRRGAMCIWSHLLDTKQAVMLALLSYSDSAGISRSLFHDGFEKLLPCAPDVPKGLGPMTALSVSVDRFSEWLAGGLQNGLLLDQSKWLEEYRVACRLAASRPESTHVAKGGDGASRAAKIARILADNAKKQKAQVVAGAQKRLAAFLSQHQKNRTARLRRRASQAKEFSGLQAAARTAAAAAQEATLQQWSKLNRRRLQNLESRGVYTAEMWSRRKVELCRERGVFGTGDFGPPNETDLHLKLPTELVCNSSNMNQEVQRPLWWRLDSTEGPMRMRRRLELDVQEMTRPRYIYDSVSGLHTPIRSAFRTPAPQSSPATAGRWQPSHDMLEPPATCARLRSEVEGLATRRTTGLVSQLMSQDLTQRIRGLYSGESGPAADGEGGIIDEDKLLWLLEPGDRLQAVFNCARLSSGDTVAGVCVVCSRHVYVFDHCVVMPSGDVAMFYEQAAALASNGANPHVVASDELLGTSSDDVAGPQAVRRYVLASIRDIQRRNYLLRPVGLEMFTSDGLNCLLIFHKSEREVAFERLWTARNNCLQQPPSDENGRSGPNKSGITSGSSSAALGGVAGEASLDMTDSSQTAELATGFWTGQRTAQTLLKKICKLWQAGEISNFQYLMHLNTLAGRSYNDLTQYPVFPWVLADYTSTELDLSNPATFRDLSKPMGAQDAVRAAEYRRRFDEWLEPDPEHPTPRFHYATHYSSAAAVTFYLVRLEPFTSAHVRLQGGRIDHADRLFTSVAGSWESASRASLSDVKELTPEFFYLPDFLLNGNRLDLGVRQRSGTAVGDVELPPWAHGSAEEFVRRHRQALESDYVSAHLHEWIDLIFGCKQRGPAAVAALNVFHHLTYEGAVDVDAITDPVEKMSTIAQILNFGQTPTQLLVKPHPPRDLARTVGGPSRALLVAGPDALGPESVLEGAGLGPVREIIACSDGRLAVAHGRCSLCPIAPNESVRWGYVDGGLRHVMRSDRKALQREVTRVVGVSRGLHFGGVTCAAYSEDGTLLVTGGAGGDVAVWDAGRGGVRDSTRSWPSIRSGGGKVTSGVTSGSAGSTGLVRLRERLCGHVGRVTCLAVCKGSGVAVSGGADRSVLMWDLNRLRFIRQLASSLPSTPRDLSISESGAVVLICSGPDLRVVGINGAELAQAEANDEESYFMCAVALPSPEWAVESPMIYSGHPNGALRLWRLVPAPQPLLTPASDAMCTTGCSDSIRQSEMPSSPQKSVSKCSSTQQTADSPKVHSQVESSERLSRDLSSSTPNAGLSSNLSKVESSESSKMPEVSGSCEDLDPVAPESDSASDNAQADKAPSVNVVGDLEDCKGGDMQTQTGMDPSVAQHMQTAPEISGNLEKATGVNESSSSQPDAFLQGVASWPLQLELITTCGGRAGSEVMEGSGGSGRFASHDAGLTAIAFAPDGAAVYTGDESGRVIRWDTGHRDRLRWTLTSTPSFWLSV